MVIIERSPLQLALKSHEIVADVLADSWIGFSLL